MVLYNIVFAWYRSRWQNVMNGNIKERTVIATSTFEGKWSANAKEQRALKLAVTTVR